MAGGTTIGLSAAGVLAACQRAAEPSPDQAAPDQGEPQELADTLRIYNWSDYVGPTTYSDFEERFGVTVVEDVFENNEEALAKIEAAGGGGWDIVVPSDYMVDIMIKKGLLAEIDQSTFTNFSNLDPSFVGLSFDPENRYSVPYKWGTTGYGVRLDKVQSDLVGSWDALWDEEYGGRIGMLNEIRETIGAALKRLGYSLNSVDESELQEAADSLIEQKPLVKSYNSSTFKELIQTGETWLQHGWSGEMTQAKVEDPDKIDYVIAQEGGTLWIDNMVVLASSPNRYTAEVFMNYILEPEVEAAIVNSVLFATPNAAAMDQLDPEVRDNPAIFPAQEVIDRLEIIEDVGDATPLYDELWTRVKGA